jgi:hypothetical protein
MDLRDMLRAEYLRGMDKLCNLPLVETLPRSLK